MHAYKHKNKINKHIQLRMNTSVYVNMTPNGKNKNKKTLLKIERTGKQTKKEIKINRRNLFIQSIKE